jgi:hypothetical protein
MVLSTSPPNCTRASVRGMGVALMSSMWGGTDRPCSSRSRCRTPNLCRWMRKDSGAGHTRAAAAEQGRTYNRLSRGMGVALMSSMWGGTDRPCGSRSRCRTSNLCSWLCKWCRRPYSSRSRAEQSKQKNCQAIAVLLNSSANSVKTAHLCRLTCGCNAHPAASQLSESPQAPNMMLNTNHCLSTPPVRLLTCAARPPPPPPPPAPACSSNKASTTHGIMHHLPHCQTTRPVCG